MARADALIFDVGKTHVKATVLAANGSVLRVRRTANGVTAGPPYSHVDVEAIWEWLLQQLRLAAAQHDIGAVGIAAHGATAALVDRLDGRLLLPVLDYEWDGYPQAFHADYDRGRPPFQETCAPALPGGLNLARQLAWQLPQLSAAQRARAVLLLYPNYWAWRLTGQLSADISSLGCHTDLWNLESGAPTSLAVGLGMSEMLPPLHAAWQPLGTISRAVSKETRLMADTQVFPGIHDSNASYVPYLKTPAADRPAVISSGTWTIAMCATTPLARLDPAQDMMAGVDARGRAVPTARYMGGREFAEICELSNCDIATTCDDHDIAAEIEGGTFARPCFASGAGPFGHEKGALVGLAQNGKAVATLYSALMVDRLLTSLESVGDVIIEGSFAANVQLCSLVAAMRPGQTVRRAPHEGGLVEGCHALINWAAFTPAEHARRVLPFAHPDLAAYVDRWRAALPA